MCGFKSHLPHQKRTPPWGRSFLVPRGAHAPCKNLVCALIEREGRTRRWSSLHTSLPLRGGRLVRFGPGAFFFGAGGAHTFCRFKSICPDGTRKTTLTVFFHTIFPSGGESLIVEVGVFFWGAKGHRKGSPLTHPLPYCYFGRGCVALGRERVAGRNEMDFCSQNLRYLFAK